MKKNSPYIFAPYLTTTPTTTAPLTFPQPLLTPHCARAACYMYEMKVLCFLYFLAWCLLWPEIYTGLYLYLTYWMWYVGCICECQESKKPLVYVSSIVCMCRVLFLQHGSQFSGCFAILTLFGCGLQNDLSARRFIRFFFWLRTKRIS